MEGFSYADPVRVKRLIKGNVTGWREDLLNESLVNLSAKLSAWYPGLRDMWLAEPEDSELRELVRVMVSEAVRKIVSNPEGMSSETMGPYAYSRFDSEDSARSLFPKADLEALERLLLAERRKKVSHIKVQPAMRPVAVERPGRRTYHTRQRWY